MKKLILFSIGLFSIALMHAQTAVNFNCQDCSGNNHDLFTELDAGKVIVISWVMPCGNCIGPTLTASNVVASYASSNPGQVFLYVCDDYANTNCTTLNNWCTANGIVATTFSNASINMLDYNTNAGMPKIVVLGGTSHTVFFNEVNSAAGNPTQMQAAIDSALATAVTEHSTVKSVHTAPNPASSTSLLEIQLAKTTDVNVNVFDALGNKVSTVFSGTMQAGVNNFELQTAEWSNGVYYIRIDEGEFTRSLELIVSH